jgi:asparagine synthase (glutamine-hydrolysing)
MNHTHYLGGIARRGCISRIDGEEWGSIGAQHELFLRGASTCAQVFKWDGIALLLRGYARQGEGPLDLPQVARTLHEEYRQTGELAVDTLDGAFTVALLDSRAERVILYRNLIGTGFTYYRVTPQGLLFAGNLTELIPLVPEARPNRDVLPSFFLYRCVPGRETLFESIERLLPGEQLEWEAGQWRRFQRHSFATLKGSPIAARDALEQTDATMTAILRDVETYRPNSANLLSGGVDSSYIQAIYNQEIARGQELPTSYCIAVDHPMTWIDTDYAITASMAIGTRHMLAPADGPYIGYLTETLGATAEPLNHVQSAYFGTLARVMAEDGIRAGLCGEGADSLFGVGLANKLHNAATVERLIPVPPLRWLASGAARMIGWDSLRRTLDRAGKRYDEADPEHPINQVACFTDRQAVIRCFGEEAVRQAEAKRRALVDQYEAGSDPLDRLHAQGFLGEAMDSAGLWATLFQRAGVDLMCPFLDSRMIRLALNLPASVRYTYRKPKALLKAALAQRVTPEIAYRVKLGFGQPIFEWLRPGGQLSGPVSRLGNHGFLAPGAVGGPTWFSYSALCYDLWHRQFIERRSLPMEMPQPSETAAA